MPFLKDIIGETYVPKPNDEKRFVEKHVTKLFQNMYADSEYDKLFKATNISTVRRSKERHGYDVGNNVGDGSGADAKVYEEKEINESNPNFRLQDVMDMAARYHEKNGLGDHGKKMGHVAHALAMAAHELKTDPGFVHAAIAGNSKNFPLPLSSKGSKRGMHKQYNNVFQKHFKKGKEFDPKKHPYGNQKKGFLYDCYIMKMDDQLWENCAYSDMHWDAVEHVAKKHGVPKELVAGSLLGNFMNMTDGDFASKRFRRDFHNYLEDKKAGIHENSDRQSSEQVLLQHEEGERQKETVGEDQRTGVISRGSGRGSGGSNGDRELSQEAEQKVDEGKSGAEKAKEVENVMKDFIPSAKAKAQTKLAARKKSQKMLNTFQRVAGTNKENK